MPQISKPDQGIVKELRSLAFTTEEPCVVNEAADMLEYVFSRFYKSKNTGLMMASMSLEGSDAEDAIRRSVDFHDAQKGKP